MQQEKIDQLEKQTSEHAKKIDSIENSLENIKPLVDEIKKVVDAVHELSITLSQNTSSNNETVRTMDRVMKRQDKQEAQTQANTNELAEARPVIRTMADLSKKMMYFGLFMVTLSISIAAFVFKG